MSTATKKFALATLSAPVLAALAIGLAGPAASAPAGPQPSDTGTTTTADPAFTSATNLVTINLPRVDPIGDGVWGQTNSPKLGTAARPAGRTTRGATQRNGLLGGGGQHTIVLMDDETLWGSTLPALRPPNKMDIGDIEPLLDSAIVLGGGRPSVSPARPAGRTARGATHRTRLLGGGKPSDKTWDDLIKQLSADGLEIRNG